MAEPVTPSSNFPSSERPNYSAIAERVIFFPFTLIGYIFQFLAACIVIPIQFIASRLFPSTDPASQAPHDRAHRVGEELFGNGSQCHPFEERSSRPVDHYERLKKDFPSLEYETFHTMIGAGISLDVIRANLSSIPDFEQIPMTGAPVSLEDYLSYRVSQSQRDIAAQMRLKAISTARGLNAFHKIKGDGNCFLYALIAGLMHMCQKDTGYKGVILEILEYHLNEKGESQYLEGYSRDEDRKVVFGMLQDSHSNLFSDELAAPFSRILRYLIHYRIPQDKREQQEGFQEPLVRLEDQTNCDIQAIKIFNHLFILKIPCFNTAIHSETSGSYVACGDDDQDHPPESPFVLFHVGTHFICAYHADRPPCDSSVRDLQAILPQEAFQQPPILEPPMSITEYNRMCYGGYGPNHNEYHSRLKLIASFYNLTHVHRTRGDGNCFANAAVAGLMFMIFSNLEFKDTVCKKLTTLTESTISYIQGEVSYNKEADLQCVLDSLRNFTRENFDNLMTNQAFLEAFVRIVRYALIDVVDNEGQASGITNRSGDEIDMNAIANLNQFFDVNGHVALIVGDEQTTAQGPDQFFSIHGRLDFQFPGVITKGDGGHGQADFVILRKEGHFDLAVSVPSVYKDS